MYCIHNSLTYDAAALRPESWRRDRSSRRHTAEACNCSTLPDPQRKYGEIAILSPNVIPDEILESLRGALEQLEEIAGDMTPEPAQ